MYSKLPQRNSLCILICVFLVLTSFKGRATHEWSEICLKNSSLSYTLKFPQTEGILLFPASSNVWQLPSISSINSAIITYFDFFGNYTTPLSLFAILILLISLLSIYIKYKNRSKENEFLKTENTKLQHGKERAELEAKGNEQCLSIICHEVRTPLSSSAGVLELLRDTDLSPEQLEYLNTLQFSSNYLISLSDNVLTLNKLNVTKPEIRNEQFNLKATFEHLINLLQNTAKENNTKIILEYDPRIPKEIIGDKTKISQILINILSNAVRFTDNGKIWIRTLAKNFSYNSVEVLIEIQDTGIGIPQDEHQLIFEPFSQGLISKSVKIGGTGLGLAIVKVLLEILGSKIHVSSDLGVGSNFWFTLDFGLPMAPEKVKQQLNKDRSAALANKSVLIVEDDLISQMITKKLLERENMNCMISDNGEEAIDLIKRKNFNLVLMDLSLHGINGQAAVKEIRKFNKQIPIIALTAVNIDEKWQELKSAGFNDVIPKPFKIDHLFKKIYRALKQNPPILTTSSE